MVSTSRIPANAYKLQIYSMQSLPLLYKNKPLKQNRLKQNTKTILKIWSDETSLFKQKIIFFAMNPNIVKNSA